MKTPKHPTVATRSATPAPLVVKTGVRAGVTPPAPAGFHVWNEFHVWN